MTDEPIDYERLMGWLSAVCDEDQVAEFREIMQGEIRQRAAHIKLQFEPMPPDELRTFKAAHGGCWFNTKFSRGFPQLGL